MALIAACLAVVSIACSVLAVIGFWKGLAKLRRVRA